MSLSSVSALFLNGGTVLGRPGKINYFLVFDIPILFLCLGYTFLEPLCIKPLQYTLCYQIVPLFTFLLSGPPRASPVYSVVSNRTSFHVFPLRAPGSPRASPVYSVVFNRTSFHVFPLRAPPPCLSSISSSPGRPRGHLDYRGMLSNPHQR